MKEIHIEILDLFFFSESFIGLDYLLFCYFAKYNVIYTCVVCDGFREETEIIEGEVVEIQVDRPATGTVSNTNAKYTERGRL